MAAILARPRCSDATLCRCLRHGRDDRLVERFGFRRKILIPAHQLGAPVAAGGETHSKFVHGRRGGGLRAALDCRERLVQRLVLCQQRLLTRRKQDRQHDAQLGATTRKRVFGERQCIGNASGYVEEISEVAGGGRDVRMFGAERPLANGECPAIERLGIGIARLMLVEAGEIVQGARDYRQRALEQRFGIRKAALPLIKRGPSRCQPQTLSILGRCGRGRRST